MALADSELMAIEVYTLWTTDARGRLVGSRESTPSPAPHVVIATFAAGRQMALGRDLPENVARALERAFAGAAPGTGSGEPPPAVADCREILKAWRGSGRLEFGPTYLVHPGVAFTSTVEVVTSADRDRHPSIAERNPDVASWAPREWRQLVSGELGPWAMAVVAGRVVAICHASRLTERAAEAGVWTDPAFRGRGYAAAATAAWASVLAPSGRWLFYSTSSGNRSSQRVAARLGLREVGWLWKLS